MENIMLSVSHDNAGQRIDVLLAKYCPSVTRSQLQRLIENGHVTADGKPVKSSHKVKSGETIKLHFPEAEASEALPEPIPIKVLFEDSDLIVIDKPAGLVVHPAAGNREGTLVNALLYHCRDLSGIGGKIRPGIVHRLDKDTSGVMVAAKSDMAHRLLADQFRVHSVKRHYTALVCGSIIEDKGRIDAPVGRHMSERKKMSVRTRRGKSAVTCFKVIERFDRFTLLRMTLETGRTHQIRVHLSSINHPVAGDAVYGGTARLADLHDAKLRKLIRMFGRQALHASVLGFIHPGTGRYIEFESPMPADFQIILDYIRGRKIA